VWGGVSGSVRSAVSEVVCVKRVREWVRLEIETGERELAGNGQVHSRSREDVAGLVEGGVDGLLVESFREILAVGRG
jgi:hypothetical protein